MLAKKIDELEIEKDELERQLHQKILFPQEPIKLPERKIQKTPEPVIEEPPKKEPLKKADKSLSPVERIRLNRMRIKKTLEKFQ